MLLSQSSSGSDFFQFQYYIDELYATSRTQGVLGVVVTEGAVVAEEAVIVAEGAVVEHRLQLYAEVHT